MLFPPVTALVAAAFQWCVCGGRGGLLCEWSKNDFQLTKCQLSAPTACLKFSILKPIWLFFLTFIFPFWFPCLCFLEFNFIWQKRFYWFVQVPKIKGHESTQGNLELAFWMMLDDPRWRWSQGVLHVMETVFVQLIILVFAWNSFLSFKRKRRVSISGMIETFISVPLCCSSWLVQLLKYLGCLSLAYYCWRVRECVVSQRKILPILSVFLTKLPLGCTHIHAECDTDADLFHFGNYSTSNRCKVPELGKVQLEIIKHKRQSHRKELAPRTMLSGSQSLNCFGCINYLVTVSTRPLLITCTV